MAEGFMKSLDPVLEVYSAGTKPASQVHTKAIQVMKEVGIDLSAHKPKPAEQFLAEPFDYVITVCDHAKATCPLFLGKVAHRLHISFDDPGDAIGTEEEVLQGFRRVRDEIIERFTDFFNTHVKK